MSPNIARKVMEQFRLLPARAGAPEAAPPPRDDGPASLDALTAREARILALIAEGLSNKEIARTVFLAEGTVKNYVSRIMEKLHARTRTELAVKALRVK
jgi:DNA-binding NarL/FixJ family response regulator